MVREGILSASWYIYQYRTLAVSHLSIVNLWFCDTVFMALRATVYFSLKSGLVLRVTLSL